MEYRKLGLTNIEISRIGFGCWAIGGHGYGKIDDRESVRAINKALDLGINFFDTADVYGFGHSETILGKALGPNKNKVVIATKFGVGWDERGKTYKDCSPRRLAGAVEASLRRLGIECIHLYQIHSHDGKTPISATMEALQKCKEEGKIGHIGCSNFPVEFVHEAFKTARIESLQCRYNILQRDFEDEISNLSNTHDIGVIVYEVLARGLFSGKYDAGSKFGINDTRSKDDNFRGEKLERTLRLVDELKRIGSQYSKSLSQIAIRWVLDNDAVTCAIVGIKSSDQIIENSGATGWKLRKEDHEILATYALGGN